MQLQQGKEILAEIGGISDIDTARKVLADTLEPIHFDRLSSITNHYAWIKIANAVRLCKPDHVFVYTGSEADLDIIRKNALDHGEERALALPGHTVHFDLPEEQGRIVDRTMYIVNAGEKASTLAKTTSREDATNYIRQYMSGIMSGKTMYVGFFSRGPAGAKLAYPAIQISSSAYAMHSGSILYRNVYDNFDQQIATTGLFFTNLHSQGRNRPEDLPNARVFMDRSWQTTFSMFCTYAGNTLLLKKGNHRFSVDLATYYGEGKILSEHMFITGLRDKQNRVTWFAGAAPSGCGKTTTAMVGSDFIGDDLAQLWIADDGTMRAINPEKGIFGIVEDVNEEGDPLLMKVLREPGEEVIWSNVCVDDKGVPHWTGNKEDLPTKGINFQGEWHPGKTDGNGNPIPLSHPNARCTVDCTAIKNYNQEMAESADGIPVQVITYSGRDADTMPPVWVAHSPRQGVVIGASLVSAATATEVNASGVKRQPWANAPFIPGPLADYMRAQFNFFGSTAFSENERPVLAGLNYFLTDGARGGNSSRLLGEKRDVRVWLSWLAQYAHGEAATIATPIGMIPVYEDLKELFGDLIGKEYSQDLYDRQFALYVDNILARIRLQREAFSQDENTPAELFEVYDQWEEGLNSLKQKHGSVILVAQLKENR